MRLGQVLGPVGAMSRLVARRAAPGGVVLAYHDIDPHGTGSGWTVGAGLLEDHILLLRRLGLDIGNGKGAFETQVTKIPLPEKESLRVRIAPVPSHEIPEKLEQEAFAEIWGQLLGEDDPTIRKACIELLAQSRSSRSREILQGALEDSDAEIRRRVKEILEGRG